MELFKIGFVTVRLIDVFDIGIVSFLFFKLYQWLKGSIALRIFLALLAVILVWRLVDLLDLVLLKTILDQVLGLGAIALIVIFAGEIRRFLLMVGRNTFLDRLWRQISLPREEEIHAAEIVRGVELIRANHYGALIVLTRAESLETIKSSGDRIGAEVSERLLYSIFMTESPLHDGAVIIDRNRVAAARCVLPLSDNPNLPPEMGLRHRSGLGISEQTDALAIIVSEERGEISVAQNGVLSRDLSPIALRQQIEQFYKGTDR